MLIVLCLFLFLVEQSFSSRILAINLSPFYSHQSYFHPLWRTLSLRGHELTLITTDPVHDSTLPNLKEINLNYTHKIFNGSDLLIDAQNSVYGAWKLIRTISIDLGDIYLNDTEVQKLIHDQNEHFDLTLIAEAMPMFAFAERFKCPLIIIASLPALPHHHRAIGNPQFNFLNCFYAKGSSKKPTLAKKVFMYLATLCMRFVGRYILLPRIDNVIKKHFGPDSPELEAILENTSAILENSNNVFWPVQPQLLNVVNIGGFNLLGDKKIIPDRIKEAMDKATNGFIYVSLGTVLQSSGLPTSTRKVLLETFKQLPYTVLWKFEDDSLEDIPHNVVLAKWLPQLSVLEHPNIQLFITQGGLHSAFESIYNNVPMICLPVYFDQFYNCDKLESFEVSLTIEAKELNLDNIKSKILQIIQEPRYKDNTKKLKALMYDQPETGMDRAIWWIEYIIRQKGARHLRNHLLDIPFYEYYHLDVIAVLGSAITIIYLIVKYIVKSVTKLVKLFKLKKE